jgi:hypothetical protein
MGIPVVCAVLRGDRLRPLLGSIRGGHEGEGVATQRVLTFMPDEATQRVLTFMPDKATQRVLTFMPDKATQRVLTFMPDKAAQHKATQQQRSTVRPCPYRAPLLRPTSLLRPTDTSYRYSKGAGIQDTSSTSRPQSNDPAPI